MGTRLTSRNYTRQSWPKKLWALKLQLNKSDTNDAHSLD
jgi:hypothetical protein